MYLSSQVVDVTCAKRFPRFFPILRFRQGNATRKAHCLDDTTPEGKEIESFARHYVTYATFLFLQLHRLQRGELRTKSGDLFLLVHCQNGRDRTAP